MNRIDKKFQELKEKKRKAFIAYITAGDPDLAATGKIVLALEKAGVDIIELGIPFSDPMADGPVIQAASLRALTKGTSLRKIFVQVGKIRLATSIPLVFMSYYNPIFKYNIAHFFADCKKTGVDGVIIPDLPCEEADEVIALGKKNDIATIFLVAPTSSPERMKMIADRSTGFIYYVSLTGVTGERKKLPSEMVSRVKLLKAITRKPVAVGFGISDARQAAQVAHVADGVIIGSAIVKTIAKKKNVTDVSRLAASLAVAIHGKMRG